MMMLGCMKMIIMTTIVINVDDDDGEADGDGDGVDTDDFVTWLRSK